MKAILGLAASLAAASLIIGCNSDPPPQPVKAAGQSQCGHAHAHAHEGPHQGHLIDLGKEDYHAELVHDDATHTVTIYLLDREAKAAVPVDLKEVLINLAIEG